MKQSSPLTFFVVAFLALVLAQSYAQPAELPLPRDLTGRMVINTGQFKCDGEQRMQTWQNESEQALYIRRAEVWMGMYRHGISDFYFHLAREERWSALGHTNWDHYAEPTAPQHSAIYSYAPDAVVLYPGETLGLRYGCSNMENDPVGHIIVTIWYFEETP